MTTTQNEKEKRAEIKNTNEKKRNLCGADTYNKTRRQPATGQAKKNPRNKETTQRRNNSKALKDKHTDLLLTTQFEENDKWK